MKILINLLCAVLLAFSVYYIYKYKVENICYNLTLKHQSSSPNRFLATYPELEDIQLNSLKVNYGQEDIDKLKKIDKDGWTALVPTVRVDEGTRFSGRIVVQPDQVSLSYFKKLENYFIGLPMFSSRSLWESSKQSLTDVKKSALMQCENAKLQDISTILNFRTSLGSGLYDPSADTFQFVDSSMKHLVIVQTHHQNEYRERKTYSGVLRSKKGDQVVDLWVTGQSSNEVYASLVETAELQDQ